MRRFRPPVGPLGGAALVLFVFAIFVAAGGYTSARALADSCPQPDPANVVAPQITGTAVVGNTLVATPGVWTSCSGPILSYSMQWYRDGAPIDGETTSVHQTTVDADLEGIEFVRVTAATATSSATTDSNYVQVADPNDDPGVIEQDQPNVITTPVTEAPAAPTPMSPQGAVSSGFTTTTDLAGADGAGTDLNVVTSTATDTTALTGVVVDDSTGAAVPGATVDFYSIVPPGCPDCQIRPPVDVTTTTDANGAFSFINVPWGTVTLTVTAPGFGQYQILNDSYDANQSYETLVMLDSSPQTYDQTNADTDVASPDTTQSGSCTPSVYCVGTSPGTNYSVIQPPPTIKVAMLKLYTHKDSGPYCESKNTQPNPVPQYHWDFTFYVTHVMQGEIGSLIHYSPDGGKAMESLIQNYAWLHKTVGGGGGADVTNSGGKRAIDYPGQCFASEAKTLANSSWPSWYQEVRTTRVVDNGVLRETGYLAGLYPGYCDETGRDGNNEVDPHKGRGSQWGIYAHTVANAPGGGSCQLGWKDVIPFYFSTAPGQTDSNGTTHKAEVVAGKPPPVPKEPSPPTISNGQITLKFLSANVNHANVAWRYYIDWKPATGGHWTALVTRHWSQPCPDSSVKMGCIPTFYTFDPTQKGPQSDACTKYRVTAWNPLGYSAPGQLNGGNAISPDRSC